MKAEETILYLENDAHSVMQVDDLPKYKILFYNKNHGVTSVL